MELQVVDQERKSQLARMYPCLPFSQRLITAFLKMEVPELEGKAKMEMVQMTRSLMPMGNPNFKEVVQYPAIEKLLVVYGYNSMLKTMCLLVKDFCNSINVVRNMTESQIIDVAAMLLDECGDFRIEDYVMMFTLAKRGQLVKILDRVDVQVIGQLMDEYWKVRHAEGKKLVEAKGNPDDEPVVPVSRQLDGPKFDPEPYIEEMKKMLSTGYDLSEEQKSHSNISPEEFAKTMGVDLAKLQEEIKFKDKEVVAFAERIVAGEKISEPKDIEFYANHKLAIEEILKQKASNGN